MARTDELMDHLSVSGPCVVAASIDHIASLTTHPKATQCLFMALWNRKIDDNANPWVPGPYVHVDLHGQEPLLGRSIEGALQLMSQLQAQEKRWRQAQAHLESFIHIVNHDLRGPLQGILGLAGLLIQREAKQLSGESRTWLTRIEDDAQRIAEMVQCVSHYGRLGVSGLKFSTFALEDALMTAFKHACQAHEERNPHLHVDGELPQVNADRQLLELSLEAIMDNAILYNHGSTPQVRVSFVQLEADSKKGWLEIHDDGFGIPEGLQSDAFEMFRRLDRNHKGGLGVGLAFVKRIAELHDEEVSLAASMHGGTVVRLGLDAAEG
jgi:histidine kinase